MDSGFREKVNQALEHARKLFTSARLNLHAADAVDHKYEDKFLLANYLTNAACACQLNCLFQVGLSEENLQQLILWQQDCNETVSIRLSCQKTCEFVREEEHERESPQLECTRTKGGETETVTRKIVTKIKEYVYCFRVFYKLYAFKGVGFLENTGEEQNLLPILSHTFSREIKVSVKSSPYQEATSHKFDVNISWLLTNIDKSSQLFNFEINRADERNCRTPVNNKQIADALEFSKKMSEWCNAVQNCFLQSFHSGQLRQLDISDQARRIFIPVVPVFEERCSRIALQQNSLDNQCIQTAHFLEEKQNHSPPTSNMLPLLNENESLTSPSTVVCASNINVLLSEHRRYLQESCIEFSKQYETAKMCEESNLLLCLSHMCEISSHYFHSLNFIEEMLRKQLISAIGRSLTVSDFGNYMRFHTKKLFNNNFQMRSFCQVVRRTAQHSPEGTLRIGEYGVGDSQISTLFEPIDTISSVQNLDTPPMQVSLNATTTISLQGERFIHGWLTHSFSGTSSANLQLIAQARQFSSFIVLLGRITSPKTFDPKFGFIVQNKDEFVIPLQLSQIPTPKEFKNAISSLSPEQQRFAQAFRSMQLESTLFAVCTIQIKPQLEKVLNLSEDSLTKEIALTQSLMELFIKYQIPSDLLSFSGGMDATSSERLEAVHNHVKAVQGLISQTKQDEIQEKQKERAFHGQCMSAFGGAAVPLPPAPPGACSFGVAPTAATSLGLPRLSRVETRSKCKAAYALPRRKSLADISCPAQVVVNSSQRVDASQLERVMRQIEKEKSYEETQCNKSPDISDYPLLLEQNYSKYDCANAIHPTIINPGKQWTKTSQKALLAAKQKQKLVETELEAERQAAFDLLEGLSRSGGLDIEHSSLHIIIGATHCFDKSVMETLVQENINPIEQVERSLLIMATTLLGVPARDVATNESLPRLEAHSPNLF